ncbi:unnamed protein product, partial [Phaeothamnion confervicola]
GGAGGRLAFQARGLVSNANYSTKRATFVLFINDRLVESAAVRKAFESAYADVLPRGAHPFAYLALTLPARHVDVNVHPTKREVHFLHEEALLEALFRALERRLRGANDSRTFYSQPVLPGVHFTHTAAAASGATSTAAAAAMGAGAGASFGGGGGGGGGGAGAVSAGSRGGGASSTGAAASGPSGGARTSQAAAVAAAAGAGSDGEDDDGEESQEIGGRSELEGRPAGGASAGKRKALTAVPRQAARPLEDLARGGDRSGGSSSMGNGSGPRKKPYAPNKLVRTDASAASIDSFFKPLRTGEGFAAGAAGGEAGGHRGGGAGGSHGGSSRASRSGGSDDSAVFLAPDADGTCACPEPMDEEEVIGLDVLSDDDDVLLVAGLNPMGEDARPEEGATTATVTRPSSGSAAAAAAISAGAAATSAAPAQRPQTHRRRAAAMPFGFVGRCGCCGKAARGGAGGTARTTPPD